MVDGGSGPGASDAGERRGGAFYDQRGVFDRYRQHQRWRLNPSLIMEEPALLDVLGPVVGARVVDLGCGQAAIGPVLLAAGCVRYLGIDGSQRMVAAARTTLRDTIAEAERCDIEAFDAAPGSFDLVLSRMALHYVEDLDPVFARAREWLSPGGRIIFSVVHPVISSHDARSSTDEQRSNWIVDDYFDLGPRTQNWLGGSVTWHHRTIEDYFAHLHRAGFALTALRECPPRADRFDDPREYARRRRIPLVLLLAGTRD